MAFSFFGCELRATIDRGPRRAGLIIGILVLVASQDDVAMAGHDHTAMRAVEGEVIAVSQQTGEGDLDLLQARLQPNQGGEPLDLLIAPAEVCAQIEFTIETGDRIRARIFMDDQRPYRVHKIHNLTRGTMVKLRTLHEIPLWDLNGNWQGGPIRSQPGRHRRGWNRQKGSP